LNPFQPYVEDELTDLTFAHLVDTEEKLKLLEFCVGSIPDAVYWLALDGRFWNVNAAACVMLGYSHDELLSLSVHDIDPDYSHESLQSDLELLKRAGTLSLRRSHTARDGRIIPVEMTLTYFIYSDVEYICCIVRDISERKQAEEALLFSQLSIDKAGIGIYHSDEKGAINYVNKYACASLGYTKEELLAKRIYDIDPAITREKMLDLKKILDVSGSVTHETVHRRKDGTTVPVVITANQLEFKGKPYVISFVKDITERKSVEESLRKAYDELESRVRERTGQLSSLTAELSLAEERERRRIATELHDQVGQTLILSKIKLDSLSRSLPSESFGKQIKEISKYLDQSIHDIRSLTFQLSPPLLYEVGFEAAVEWLGEEFEEKYGLHVEFQDDGRKKPLAEESSVALYQMVRELLLNITKHAKAKRVRISVSKVSGKIKISLTDDGSGFDSLNGMLRKNKKSGFGLFNIRQRIEYLGGEFLIESEIGCGTRATLLLPIKKKLMNRKIP
jgi:PAS domain S-box-containing protein